jgi:hypothetical protein
MNFHRRISSLIRSVCAKAQVAFLLFALPAAAGPLLSPSTTTYGGIVSGGNFVTGAATAGFSGNGWPSVQGPAKAVDGLIGPGSKYLNFNITNTALIFSGTTAKVAERLELWVAEDAVERDPSSYTIYGTNAAIPALTSGGTFALSNFTLISTGGLALPAARDTVADATGNSQIVSFPNTTAYTSYLVVFPNVKNLPTAANSMQISEVQLYDRVIAEPPDQANTGGGTVYTLVPGQNTFTGTVNTSGDGQDRFQVLVPDGMLLTAASKTTDGGTFTNGFVSFNNQSLNGLGGGAFGPMPLGFGT